MRERLQSLADIYRRILTEGLSEAVVTVRSADGCLLGVACVSESSLACCLDLDLLTAAPQTLLGERPPGPTPGEAALAACVWLSLKAGYGGQLEAQPLATAGGWYRARGFRPGSLGHLCLGTAAARAALAPLLR
jgi:hypothetical protein